jgi:site-specific DNA-cytosine methylase
MHWDFEKGGEVWQNASKFVAGHFDREFLTSPDYVKNNEVIVFKERAGQKGGGKGILYDRKIAFTLATIIEQAICYESTNGKKTVRRFTPTEMARLQGFPDWWCDGVEGKYLDYCRLWGNWVALPCVVDVIGRLVHELKAG